MAIQTIKERCAYIQARAPNRQPREDEIMKMSVCHDGEDIPIAIFYECVFDVETKTQIGYLLTKEKGFKLYIFPPLVEEIKNDQEAKLCLMKQISFLKEK